MNRKRLGACVLASMLWIGCSDTVNLSGVYEVDRHTANMEGCTNEMPVSDSPGYIQFFQEEIVGQPYYEWEWCQDAAGADCEESSGYSLYGEPIPGGWESRLAFSSGSGEECTLGLTLSTAVLMGDALRIDTRYYLDTIDVSPDECDPDYADERGDSLPCVEIEVIDATRI